MMRNSGVDPGQRASASVPTARFSLPLTLTLAAISALAGAPPAAASEAASFTERDVFGERSTLRFFDLGIADVDGNGLLDVYTSNHSDLQSLWINLGDWSFEDRFAALGLHQDTRHPGLESLPDKAPTESGSMRVYWWKRRLVIEARELADPEAYNAKLTFYGEVEVKQRGGFKLRKRRPKPNEPWARSGVSFRPPRNGTLELAPEMVPAPIELRFDDAEAARRVYLGRGDSPLEAPNASFALRDRKGMAWADVDEDGRLDVFITRGGLRGELIDPPFSVSDELLIQSDGGMRDAASEFGLTKPYARSRRAMWADFDSDGHPDLLITSLAAPAQVLLRRENRFVESGQKLGIASIRFPVVAVANFFGDASPEILVGEAFGVSVYRNRSGRYRSGIPITEAGETLKIIAGDVDGDGDLDALVVSDLSKLLVNGGDSESFETLEAASIGLPGEMIEANWVDYDLDGDLDVFAIPGGLYAQTSPLTFERTDHFPRFEKQREAAYSAWADLDNDGDLDLVLATQDNENPRSWHVHAYENRRPVGQWLQVELKGPPGNPHALGAAVTLRVGECRQTRRVGEFEGARYSQGHYRIYFGLGDCQGEPSLLISWPNGTTQQAKPSRNQRVRIEWSP